MIPSLEQCFFLESDWGAALAFSNTPFDDFFFIFSAILLEVHVVFFSKNVSLLTASILTFYGLLKPFKYPYPIMQNLPESMIKYIEAPVPILIGINQDFKYID